MRLQLLVAVLGLGTMLGVLGGCGGGNEFRDPTVTGTVVTDGTPIPNATVLLFKDGQPFLKPFITSANGSFSFANLSAGSYALEVTAGANNVESFVGPFSLTTSQNITMTAPSPADLTALGVATPTNNSTTLVVYANDAAGNQLQSFTANVGALSATSTPNITPFAKVTGITASSATVVVTNTVNNMSSTLNNVSFTPNTIVYFQAVIPSGG